MQGKIQDVIKQSMSKSINSHTRKKNAEVKRMFPVGLEPATFRVWGGRDNHYTTETLGETQWALFKRT